MQRRNRSNSGHRPSDQVPATTTITTFVRIAPSAEKRRASFIRGPATPTSRAADEAGISQPAWSSVGGKLNTPETLATTGGNTGGAAVSAESPAHSKI